MHDFSTVEINKYLITSDEQSHVLCLHSLANDKLNIRCQELLHTSLQANTSLNPGLINNSTQP